MASYEYTVEICEPQTETSWVARHWAEMVRHEGTSVLPWTDESAIAYAHRSGSTLEDGTEIRILRRRASNAPRRRGDGPTWQSHRRYLVQEGIARRTDR